MYGYAGSLADGIQTGHHAIRVAIFERDHFSVIVGLQSTHVVMHGRQHRYRLFGDVYTRKNLGGFGDARQFFMDDGRIKMGQIEMDMIFLGADMLNSALALSQMPTEVANAVATSGLPPVAVILMAAPILLPIITAAGFDPYWFAVIVTINMEIGLITPPVGLNLYVINGIAPDISLRKILVGSMPFVLCMVLAIVILSAFPGIVTWLPDVVMGPELAR